ncbi:MAG: hypothetical protein Ct9H90mP14_3240 [Methanobacteriota archaeon]|nr:MAG: hypothetical protein Ct9H90mP14_3240 [Euryarchaeota archaeon]
MVCGFARIHGYPFGIVANNGILFSESSLKGAHFVELCGQRGVPLIFLQNITGFRVWAVTLSRGIAKDGAKLVTAVSCVPFPQIYSNYRRLSWGWKLWNVWPSIRPTIPFMWPNARISFMGGPQAADVLATSNKINGPRRIVSDVGRRIGGVPCQF